MNFSKSQWYGGLIVGWVLFFIFFFTVRPNTVDRLMDSYSAEWTSSEIGMTLEEAPETVAAWFELTGKRDRFKRLKNFNLTDEQVRAVVRPKLLHHTSYYWYWGMVVLFVVGVAIGVTRPWMTATQMKPNKTEEPAE